MNSYSFDAEKEFSNTACFGGTNFQDIRKKVEMEKKQDIPKNLANIAYLWKEIKSIDTKRLSFERQKCLEFRIALENYRFCMEILKFLATEQVSTRVTYEKSMH